MIPFFSESSTPCRKCHLALSSSCTVKGYDANAFHALCGAAIGLFVGYFLGASGVFTWGKVRRQVEELGDRMLLLAEYAAQAEQIEAKVKALVARSADMDGVAFREEARTLMVELDAVERRAEEVTGKQGAAAKNRNNCTMQTHASCSCVSFHRHSALHVCILPVRSCGRHQ